MFHDPSPSGPLDFEGTIFSVSEINRLVKKRLEIEFDDIWVEGEISNFRAPSSGHYYFSLKDETGNMRAVMFRSQNARLSFSPDDGMLVLARGRLTLYEPRGDYQIQVYELEPRGEGALRRAFGELKKRLEAEGLFDPERKRELPVLPQRIGIVTSSTGAAIRDILRVIERRFANVEILIHPVRVQGKGAGQEIVAAIEYLNQEHPELDVLIVTRGGGSLEDLWAFNEEIVARSLFASTIPTISAVGHEIDFTIVDFVADVRAPTPSAAAELVVRRKDDLLERIQALAVRLESRMRDRLSGAVERIIGLTHHRAFRETETILNRAIQQLDERRYRLFQSAHEVLLPPRRRVDIAANRLAALDPLAILRRGYTMTLDEKGEPLRSIEQTGPAETLRTILADGRVVSTVDRIEETQDFDGKLAAKEEIS